MSSYLGLTGGGALLAAVVGVSIVGGAGWAGGAVLAAFYVSSTLVSRLEPAGSLALLDPKRGPRDALQVLANGGPAAAGALLARLAGGSQDLALWIVTASLAAAAADTWGTGLGSRSSRPPRHIISGARVPAGTSGGVSPLGTAGAAAGALVTALTGAAMGGGTALLAAGVMIGVAGMLFDSVLGAALQGRFYCPACERPSEWRRHRCGAPTTPLGGLPWLTNDGVNAIATATAAAAGAAAWFTRMHCC